MHPICRFLLTLGCALALGACSSLPQPTPSHSDAIADYQRTPLAQLTQSALAGDSLSGFRLLPYGPNSFTTRIELARLATRSLDVQYYLLKGDHTGMTLMRALRDASLRGVRVRLLIDDLYTAGEDELLLGLAAHPNVQVRLFNPFPVGRDSLLGRFMGSALDWRRVNRRMHNKLFVADNAAAVAGGRNMADEYVMNAQGSNFIDMDVFAAGPVVRELSQAFDSYWNSPQVYPVQRIAASAQSLQQLRERFDSLTALAVPPQTIELTAAMTPLPEAYPARESVSEDIVTMLNLPFELARGKLGPLLPAKARVLFDPLSKTEGRNEDEDTLSETVTEGVVNWLKTARRHIKLVSPYFVPNDAAVASMAQARAHGVGVDVITNSLAATDESWVYVGYSTHVKELLRLGVNVAELSPTLSVKRKKLGIFGQRSGALHMKSAIVDHAQVFLGSMNLDARSAKINTELGLLIESPEMARQLEGFSDAGSIYRLRLSKEQEVQWVETEDDGSETVHDEPPETSAWLRFKLRLLSPFIPESEL